MERKKALVTGGDFGMGRGIATVLSKNGYDVCFSYFEGYENYEKAVETTKNELEKNGAKCYAVSADLSKKDAPKKLFDEALDCLGRIDLLVNNAGVNMPLPIQDITEENFDYLVTLDLRSYVMLIHYVSRYMIDNDIKGNIVNVSSSRGERAYPNASIYCGIKAGLNRMVEAFALDLCHHGIRINNVAPGAIRVRSKEELLDITEGSETDYFWNKEYIDNPDAVEVDFWDSVGAKIPLERAGTPEEVGDAVAFLASSKASYITGVTLRVDGGIILPGMPEDPDFTGGGWA